VRQRGKEGFGRTPKGAKKKAWELKKKDSKGGVNCKGGANHQPAYRFKEGGSEKAGTNENGFLYVWEKKKREKCNSSVWWAFAKNGGRTMQAA